MNKIYRPTDLAFPRVVPGALGGLECAEGMDLRTCLAGLAMAGLMASPDQVGVMGDMAALAVGHADALIAELNKSATPQV
jgi:hypothetical protein